MIPGGLHHVMLGLERRYSVVISSNVMNLNLANYIGNPSGSPVTVDLHVMPGVVVGSVITGAQALTVGALPSNSVVNLLCEGYIVGCGGAGGSGGSSWAANGAPGGHAIWGQPGIKLNINNQGVIGGGGGGGGGQGNRDVACGGSGGAGHYAGGAGTGSGAAHANANGYNGNLTTGGPSNQAIFSWEVGAGGAGGNIGSWGGVGNCTVDTSYFGSGGGPGCALVVNGGLYTLLGNGLIGPIC